MSSIRVYVEAGKKRTFAGALDWPGWSRRGRDEVSALQALMVYGVRYARVVQAAGLPFRVPTNLEEFTITERLVGNGTTDFGSPAMIPAIDREPFSEAALDLSQKLLRACWREFDGRVQGATGKELRKGPRGGGRDLDTIIDHVIEADKAYLPRLAWKFAQQPGENRTEHLRRTRQAILEALDVAAGIELPSQGPRGGVIWPPRYFVRRVAWHVLDHAWEIEDRVL